LTRRDRSTALTIGERSGSADTALRRAARAVPTIPFAKWLTLAGGAAASARIRASRARLPRVGMPADPLRFGPFVPAAHAKLHCQTNSTCTSASTHNAAVAPR
jgi:hypothetical protein